MIILKNSTQIDGIRKSCKLLAKLFDEVLPQIHEGMTTLELNALCHNFMKQHNGRPAWFLADFDYAACISVNEEVIHGIPSKKRILRNGDLVSLDVGIDLDGFISDSSHTVKIGNVSPEKERLMKVTEECLYAGIAACKAGNRINDISKAVYEVAHKAGFGVVRDYSGHGVGIHVHEDPRVPNFPSLGSNPRIQEGMVLAIGPMITLGKGDVYEGDDGWTVITCDGSTACHFEHTVAVFRDHTEILTKLD
jgi:methionyl aminopeptidase